MDNYDCFISEADVRTSQINSPGPSSGYCSAEEGHKFPTDSALFRDVDSPWRVHSPFLNRATDPCIGGTMPLGAGQGVQGINVDAGGADSFFTDTKNNLSFDDLMDTLWDPFGAEMTKIADFASTETITDVEMSDSPSVLHRSNYNTSSSGDGTLISLLRGTERIRSASRSDQNSMGNNNFNQVTSIQPEYSVNTNNSTANSSRRRKNNASSKGSLSRTVSSMHQHMANISDMGTVNDDEDYLLHLLQDSSVTDLNSRHTVLPAASNRVQAQSSTIMNGVFGQRSSLSNIRTCEPKTLSGIKSGAVNPNCGNLLRSSATIPASLHASLSQNSLGRSLTEYNFKNGVSSSNLLAQSSDRSVSTCDMRGGRTSFVHPGLDDHRYTLKPAYDQHPKLAKQKKMNPSLSSNALNRCGGGASNNHSFNYCSNSSISSANGTVRATSILEAFLRSTRPMDPNKGSNAVLAAEGLSYLQHDHKEKKKPAEPPLRNGRNSSGMLLKKLLTGEIDQKQVLEDGDHVQESYKEEETSLPIESPLTDGFGLDVDFDDSQILGSLLENGVPGIEDSIWLGDLADKLGATDLEEILKEQSRQDELWHEHYIDKLV